MGTRETDQSKVAGLRQQAEELFKGQPKAALNKLTTEEAERLIHELRVHQIELEMQNEELRCTQEALEASRSKYADLYDFAPSGYFTLDKKGLILEANLTGAGLLGIERSLLIRKPFSSFVEKDHQDLFYLHCRKVFDTSDRQTCKIRLKKKDGNLFYAQMESIQVRDPQGRKSCRASLIDITGRKRAEEALQKANEELNVKVRDRTYELESSVGLLQDEINERKQAEEVLRERDERHRTILQTAMDGFWLVDMQGRLLEVNETYCQMSGYSEQELLAMSIPDLEAAEAPNDTSAHIQKIMAQGEDRFETLHRRKDGSIFDAEVSVQYRPSDGGRFVGFMRDITERKGAEKEFQMNEAKLREAQRLAKIGNWEWDIAADIILWSPELYRLTGHDPQEPPLRFTELTSLYTPESWEQLQSAVKDAIILKKPYELVLEVVRRNGEHWWQIAFGEPVINARDEVVKLRGAVQDITERKLAEDKLREAILRTQDEKAKVDAIIAAIGDALSIQDTNFKVLYQNDVHKGFVGQHIGEYCYEAYEKSDKMCEGCPVAMAFNDGMIHITERSAPTQKGLSYFEISASPLRNVKGEIIAGIEIARDITRRKEAENNIIIYQEQLRALMSKLGLTEEKERKRISEDLHDNISQNLAISKMKLEEILESSPAISKDLNEIHEQIEQIIKFIRTSTFELSSPILYELGFISGVEWIIEKFREKHKVDIKFVCDKNLADPKGETGILLYKTVRELLMNIIKHSQAHKAKVSIFGNGSNIGINVEDNGIGFDASKIDLNSIKNECFGILSIRERIKYLKGTFEINSGPDRGTKVRITVPR